ncbi:MAG: SgcJ/EcaC family oxidoreductase [Actinobacteria bacterium]|nr:SgcJ/EcaC family oxidoreductase [Actinomycetota bacterium]
MRADIPEELHALLAEAFNRGDVEAFLAVYEPDAVMLMPPDGQVIRGTDALRAAVAPLFAARPRFASQVVGKLEADGIAMTHARWTLLAGAEGERHEESGVGTVLSRRQPDGRWLIALDNPLTPP